MQFEMYLLCKISLHILILAGSFFDSCNSKATFSSKNSSKQLIYSLMLYQYFLQLSHFTFYPLREQLLRQLLWVNSYLLQEQLLQQLTQLTSINIYLLQKQLQQPTYYLSISSKNTNSFISLNFFSFQEQPFWQLSYLIFYSLQEQLLQKL